MRRVLSDVTDADERHFVVGHLFNYANTMDLVQQIPTALRLKFFACAATDSWVASPDGFGRTYVADWAKC